MARDFNAGERSRRGGPSPFAGEGGIPLTDIGRIRARHLLQELSENALSVRNAADPLHGMHTIRRDQRRAQSGSLTAELRYFTGQPGK